MNEKIFGELDKNKYLKTSGLHQIHSISKSKYKTIPDMFINSCELHKDNHSLGSREILKHSDFKKSIKYGYMGKIGNLFMIFYLRYQTN